MAVFISLLRGINVGGNKKILMADLKTLYESLGFSETKTLLQSGNAVFKTDLTDSTEIADLIEAGIEKTFGFQSRIIMRVPDQFRQVLQTHPFPEDQLAQPSRISVTFLTSTPSTDDIDKLLKEHTGPETLTCIGQELYMYFPEGMAETKLSNTFLEKRLKTTGTARNWNTVNKLLTLAETLEG